MMISVGSVSPLAFGSAQVGFLSVTGKRMSTEY